MEDKEMDFFKKFSKSMKMSKKMADMKAQFPKVWQFAEKQAQSEFISFCLHWHKSEDIKVLENLRRSLSESEKRTLIRDVVRILLPDAITFFEQAALEELDGDTINEQAIEAFGIAYGTKLIDLLESYYGKKEKKD